MFARQGMSQSTRTPTLSQVRAVCTQREPTGRVIIVIVAEREEREDKRGKRAREKRREKRRKRREEKAENTSVCSFKTPPCVRSGRLRVYEENARMFNTCGRFLGTHGGVLNLHTERFSACQAAPHHTTNRTHNTTTQRTHPQHQNSQRTSHTHTQHIHHRTHQHQHQHTHTHTHELLDTCTAGNRRKSECLDMCTAVNRPRSCTR